MRNKDLGMLACTNLLTMT